MATQLGRDPLVAIVANKLGYSSLKSVVNFSGRLFLTVLRKDELTICSKCPLPLLYFWGTRLGF